MTPHLARLTQLAPEPTHDGGSRCTRRGMARLVRALDPGESVLHATLGEHWGRQALIAVTDRRVVVVPAGLFPGAAEELCHADVCWVETGLGMISGTLTVVGSGQRVLQVSGIVPQQRAKEIAAEARTRALSAAGMSGDPDRAVGIG